MTFLQFCMVAGIIVFIFICFIMCLVCLGKISKLSKDVKNDELSEEIQSYYEAIKKMAEKGSFGAAPPVVEAVKIPQGTLCKIGVVHFNAFPDVTGAISFATAILDSNNNGIILTSLYGRDTSNTYLRVVEEGNCNITLLSEEQEALEKAIAVKTL